MAEARAWREGEGGWGGAGEGHGGRGRGRERGRFERAGGGREALRDVEAERLRLRNRADPSSAPEGWPRNAATLCDLDSAGRADAQERSTHADRFHRLPIPSEPLPKAAPSTAPPPTRPGPDGPPCVRTQRLRESLDVCGRHDLERPSVEAAHLPRGRHRKQGEILRRNASPRQVQAQQMHSTTQYIITRQQQHKQQQQPQQGPRSPQAPPKRASRTTSEGTTARGVPAPAFPIGQGPHEDSAATQGGPLRPKTELADTPPPQPAPTKMKPIHLWRASAATEKESNSSVELVYMAHAEREQPLNRCTSAQRRRLRSGSAAARNEEH